MAYYRLYLLSREGSRFVGFEEIDAADDIEALRLAQSHLDTQPLELWCGARKVRTLPARTPDPA